MVRCVGLRQNEATLKPRSWFYKLVDCQMLSGFPANSVFIVDSEDVVRHQTVLDPRFNDFYEGRGEVEHDDFVVDDGDV